MESANLYEVKCYASAQIQFGNTLKVYVIARSNTDAQQKALAKMKELGWNYDTGASEPIRLGTTNWMETSNEMSLLIV
jgi:hypothetical protein